MKQLMIAVTIVGLISLIGFSVVMANATSAPDSPVQTPCPNCPVDGTGTAGSGVLHDYMSSALANALGIDVEEYIARRDAGETFFDMAAELGFDFDALIETRIQARTEALEQAYADGVLSEEQYQFMLTRAQNGSGMGFGMGFGASQGNQQVGGYGHGRNGGGMWNSNGTQNPDCPNYQAVP